MSEQKISTEAAAILETIARETMDLPTLTERRRDSLDFHELHVATIERGLRAAYEAGLAAAKKGGASR